MSDIKPASLPENLRPTIDREKYPHVRPFEFEIIEKYGHHFNNLGGNEAADLLNDYNKPSPNNLMRVNIVRFTLATMVHSQVLLLRSLESDGMVA
jgi:hypothetical protein